MSIGIDFKVFDSLQKPFLNSLPNNLSYKTCSMFKNEIFSYVISYKSIEKIFGKYTCSISVESPIEKYVHIRHIGYVPSILPAYTLESDNYLSTAPGLFPDVLEPITNNEVPLSSNCYQSLWVMIEPDENVRPDEYKVKLTLANEEVSGNVEFSIRILPASLPEQKLIYTDWFHPDCVAHIHNVEIFSEKHWEIMERYISLAVKYGMNMLYTPVFTPPLDTEIGNYRDTVQLVGVSYDGKYEFDFSLFERWINVAKRCGILYFEISHLFTQWGCKHAPKIMATVDGEYKRIFGWDTKSDSNEYIEFLDSFLIALLEEIEKLRIKDKVYFHVSDEPSVESLGNYKNAANIMKKYVKDYPIIDALSDYEFYEEGLVNKPIPSSSNVEIFIENGVKNLWTYYCCAQHSEVSNRFMAMPSYRNRIIGVQLYKYNLEGFLHWGYNFYNSGLSKRHINPYCVTDADMEFPSGDAFIVYPYKDEAIESIRMIVFNEALQDIRAFQMLEKLKGREYVIDLIDDNLSNPITFKTYPQNSDYIIKLRERVNMEIITALQNNN